MRLSVLVGLSIVVSAPVVFSRGAKEQSVERSSKMVESYDGDWWSASAPDERSGFLEGAADCLTWVARTEGFSSTSSQLVEKITRYYRTHPNDKRALVIDVWQRVGNATDANPPKDGEVWKNAHWYLNGLWWRQSSESERLGFLAGYLWCFRTRVPPPKDDFSRSPRFYMRKIDEHVRAHPKADDEAVATILERFRDGSAKQQIIGGCGQGRQLLIANSMASVSAVRVTATEPYTLRPPDSVQCIWVAVDDSALLMGQDLAAGQRLSAGTAKAVPAGATARFLSRTDRGAQLIIVEAQDSQPVTIRAMTLKPRQEIWDASDRNDTLLVAISSLDLRDIWNIGDESQWVSSRPEDIRIQAGFVRWLRSGTHRIRNLLPTESKFVALEW